MANIKLYKSCIIYALAFTVSEILAFEIFYLEKVGQGYGYNFHNDAILKTNKHHV